jgi:flagellar capping protein FliD
MGSDLRLTGLASGMDWQPIVEKLLELEAVPKKRLEAQKKENEAKVSDLGLLKSQLDTLKGASAALQNEDLFESRSIQKNSGADGISASALTGALTGEFTLLVESVASRTQIASSNRSSSRLSKGIDLNQSLRDLPLNSPITTGTFTISGKTLNISSLDITLQDLLDEINSTNNGVDGINPEGDSSGITFSYDADQDKMVVSSGISEQDSANLMVLGSSTDSSNFLHAMKLIGPSSAGSVTSTNALASIDMRVSLASANFASSFTGLNSGLGNFFIGEGEGAVRIDYDVNNDTLDDLINRVNDSSANVFMFYDPISDRFVARNKELGAVGIVMHETADWDTISSANKGNGNILSLMGLAPPSAITDTYDNSNLANYNKGDLVDFGDGTYWQTLTDSPTEDPTADSEQWVQVIPGVVRAMASELGSNAAVRINGGDLIYSTKNSFSAGQHGYEGITFEFAQVSIGSSATFTVSKDSSAAKNAITKFVEEFNDAQDYISSLTKVDQTGDEVQSSRFTGNMELSRLGSQLRRTIFGSTTPHSESGATVDSSNLTISANNGTNDEINAIATQMNLDASDDGYVIKVLDQNATGQAAYFEWDGAAWQSTTPSFSTFRLASIGLDFGTSSNKLNIEDSSLLTQQIEDNPELVMALFSEAPVEASYDSITQTERDYEGITFSLNDYIDNFLSGNDSTGYKGAYQAMIDSLDSQNERIDEKIVRLDKYLESREKILNDGFMRMEEMQSKMDTQMQTLQSTFNNNNKK